MRTLSVADCTRVSHGAHGDVRRPAYAVSRAQPAHLWRDAPDRRRPSSGGRGVEDAAPYGGCETKVAAYDTAGVFWHKALGAYLGTQDEDAIRAVEEKAMVVGYARLMRRTIRRNGLNTEEGRATIEHCKRRLVELIDRVDNLYF